VTLAALVDELARTTIGATRNFYRDGEGAERRRARLRAYLEERATAPLVLVAEAPGYRGTAVSGIPLTSERQLSGAGPAEATATIVHRVLAELGLEPDVLLWNVVPTHPCLPGLPASNRADAGRGRGLATVPGGRYACPAGRSRRTRGGADAGDTRDPPPVARRCGCLPRRPT
jgi:hypothetical protein